MAITLKDKSRKRKNTSS